MRTLTALLILLSAVPLILQAQTAPAAGGVTLTPTRLVLSAKAPTALLSLSNGKSEPVRLQLSVFAWTQSPKGEMTVAPTDDIVFFPPLLTVSAGEERKIRIGSPIPFGAAEKSYRLIVEELPPLEKLSASGDSPGIHMLMKFSLPIFIEPSRVVSQAQIEGLAMEDRRFSFRVKNQGNIHLLLQKVSVKGTSKSGEAVFARELPGWYVLAGDARNYAIELGTEECGNISELTVEARNEGQTAPWSGHFKPQGDSCGAQPGKRTSR